jgi:NADP-dependent aldehyde dehydrogenase
MTTKPVLIAGEWRQAKNAVGTFTAVDPATKTPLGEVYPVSGVEDVEHACQAGLDAAATLRSMPAPAESIARFLEDYAAKIEAAADALVEMAARETGYPVTPRLKVV